MAKGGGSGVLLGIQLRPVSLCSLAHELRLSCMQRKKVQIQSSDPSALASDRFNLILVSGRALWMPERGRYPRRLLAHCWQPDLAVQKPVAVEAVKPVFSCDFNPWECHMLGSSPPPLVTH